MNSDNARRGTCRNAAGSAPKGPLEPSPRCKPQRRCFKNRKPTGEVGCCESRMAEGSHWWTDRWLRSLLFLSLSLSLSVSFSDYLPTYPPIYLCINLSLSLSSLSSLSLCLSLSLSLSLSGLSKCATPDTTGEKKTTQQYIMALSAISCGLDPCLNGLVCSFFQKNTGRNSWFCVGLMVGKKEWERNAQKKCLIEPGCILRHWWRARFSPYFRCHKRSMWLLNCGIIQGSLVIRICCLWISSSCFMSVYCTHNRLSPKRGPTIIHQYSWAISPILAVKEIYLL